MYTPSPFRGCLVSSTLSITAPAPTAIYTLSLHDALPISRRPPIPAPRPCPVPSSSPQDWGAGGAPRAERHLVGLPQREIGKHTSELQSLRHLVCRLLLEKKRESLATTGSHATTHAMQLIS